MLPSFRDCRDPFRRLIFHRVFIRNAAAFRAYIEKLGNVEYLLVALFGCLVLKSDIIELDLDIFAAMGALRFPTFHRA